MKAGKLQDSTDDAEAEIAYFPFLILSYILIFYQYFDVCTVHHFTMCIYKPTRCTNICSQTLFLIRCSTYFGLY